MLQPFLEYRCLKISNIAQNTSDKKKNKPIGFLSIFVKNTYGGKWFLYGPRLRDDEFFGKNCRFKLFLGGSWQDKSAYRTKETTNLSIKAEEIHRSMADLLTDCLFIEWQQR
jgi:hypothetical protein